MGAAANDDCQQQLAKLLLTACGAILLHGRLIMLTRWTAFAAVIFVSGTALSSPMDGKGLQGTVA